MDPTEAYYEGLIAELRASGLDSTQILGALTSGAPKELHSTLDQLVKRQAQFFTEKQYPEPDSAYSMDQNDSAYATRLKSINSQPSLSDEECEVEDIDPRFATEAHNQVVNLITETASMADKRGLKKQAEVLDQILVTLIR